jgi:hypothetical protein
VKTHSVGHDGWVKDVVLAVKGTDQQIASMLSSLNQLLFSTSYKAYVLPLPAQVPNRISSKLDLKITAGELKSWILDQAETFTPLEGGRGLSLNELFSQPESGVYFSGTPGIIGWWIPQEKDIQSCRVQARQFTLDSDLIIGGLSKPSGVLVLGRERVVPVDALPPLRAETISLLAAVQKGQGGELKQSYERKHLFAGRMDGHRDWAPILLSPELVDTEYGSLLNVTDQILKSWTENGDVRYDGFEEYPRPPRGPFSDRRLMTRLKTKELTYNWNTKGAGYSVKLGDYSLLALNRSGALPVSYIPEGTEGTRSREVAVAEDEAYEYFAGLSDPNLVRVVQYNSLYQIFSAFDVKNRSLAVQSDSRPADILERLTDGIIKEVRNTSSKERARLARQLLPMVARQIGDDGYLLDYITEQLEQLDETGPLTLTLYGDTVGRVTLSELAVLKKLPEQYADEVASGANGWIHTPVVVVSTNGFNMIGGHNLDAKITRFSISEETVVGRAKVEADGTILINPKDADRISEVVRTAGLNETKTAESLSTELNSALNSVREISQPIRQVVLELPPSPASDLRFGPPLTGENLGARQPLGWGRFRSQAAMTEADLAALRESRSVTPGSWSRAIATVPSAFFTTRIAARFRRSPWRTQRTWWSSCSGRARVTRTTYNSTCVAFSLKRPEPSFGRARFAPRTRGSRERLAACSMRAPPRNLERPSTCSPGRKSRRLPSRFCRLVSKVVPLS